MISKIKQLRFPSDKSLNFTSGWSENLIKDLGLSMVTQLGIYALPGTRFKINQGNSFMQGEELIINGLGIFNIDVKRNPISNIQLSEESYKNLTDNHFIVIDLVYEEV